MATSALAEVSKTGAFSRSPSVFRSRVSAEEVESGRYILYVSLACPWACSALSVYYMKGLSSSVDLSICHPVWQYTKPRDDEHMGWTFAQNGETLSSPTGNGSFTFNDLRPDPVNNCRTVRELYELADPSYSGKFTVPVLWDKQKQTIVNNESMDIIRMFNGVFSKVATEPNVDLNPPHLQDEIEALHPWIYNRINNGVYKAGFARTQEAYDEANGELVKGLEDAEKLLSQRRYLASNDNITEPDIRLYQTLVRYDDVYVTHFKCNSRCIREMPNLFNYAKDLYQNGLWRVTNQQHYRTHYPASHPTLNAYSIVYAGPGIDWNSQHDRENAFP